MYDEIFTQKPIDDDHFWEMVESNFDHARHIIDDFHVESEQEAIDATFRRAGNEKIRLNPFTVIAYRRGDQGYDLRDYCLDLGRKALLDVEKGIEGRILTSEFVQSWGILQYCHGYLSSLVFETNDGLGSVRGGLRKAQNVSVDQQRIWMAKFIVEEVRKGIYRKNAEFNALQSINKFIKSGGWGDKYPAEWFDEMLNNKKELKSTYRSTHLYGEEMHELASKYSDELPPLSPTPTTSGP